MKFILLNALSKLLNVTISYEQPTHYYLQGVVCVIKGNIIPVLILQ